MTYPTNSHLAVVVAALALSSPLAAEEHGDAMGVGEAAWIEHCAVCHGRSGAGDGPFVPMLRTPPPDLRMLSESNGGKFPQRRVEKAVDGRGMPGAHGTADMPVWGRVWRTVGETEPGVKARLIAVIAYLRTLQQ